MTDENLLPQGSYRARAHSWDLGETSTGAEQIAISFMLVQPGFENQYIAYYGTFGEKALEHTVRAMRACGWTGIDLNDLTGLDANEVTLVVEHETYNNVTRAKVRWVNSGVGTMLKKVLDPASKKNFGQRMRGAIAALETNPKAANGAKPPPPAGRQPNPPPHGDDDIPF